MTDADFADLKRKLDAEIDKLGSEPSVGIQMGLDLYTEFRKRGLLKDAVADFTHWKFTLQGYRDLFVSESAAVVATGFMISRV
jgi:hypothetical protein